MNKINLFLIFSLIFSLALGGLACAPEPENKKETQAAIRAYLMNHPEVVIEIINNANKYKIQHEDNQREAVLKQSRQALTAAGPGTFVRGAGDITLVEFFDYQCGYCKTSFNPMMEAAKKDKSVQLVLKEFPILGETSRIAAQAAIASQKQGLYLKFHTALMTTPGRLSESKIFQIAQMIGLDIKKLRQDMKSKKIAQALDENYALAKNLSITGTPAFILIGKNNAEFLPGAKDEKEFMRLFKQARSQ